MSLLANVGRLVILRLVSQATSLLAIVYFTRSLSPGILGEYFYFASMVGLGALFADFGTSASAEKFVSEGDEPDEWYSIGLIVTGCLSIVAIVIFFPVNLVFGFLRWELAPYFALTLVSGRYLTYYKHMFRAGLRASFGGIMQLMQSGTFAILGIAAIHLEYGVIGLIFSLIVSRTSPLLLGIFYSSQQLVYPELEKAKKLGSFSKYNFITMVGTKVINYMDIILLGLLISSASVGRYEVAWRIIVVGIGLNGIVANTIFSYVSRSSSTQNISQVQSDIQSVLRYVLFIPFGLLVGASIIGPEVITLLFTSQYVASPYLLIILSIGFVFQSFYFLFSKVLVAMNYPRESFYATLITITSNISLNIILIPVLGSLGAAAATTFSFIIAAIAFYWYLRQHLSITFPIYRFAIQSGASLVMGGALLVGRHLVGNPTSLDTVALVTVGGSVYLGLLCTSPDIRSDILQLMNRT